MLQKSLLQPAEESVESAAAKIARNMEIYFRNPWAMVEDGAIWTLDSTNLVDPIRQFPNWPWLQHIAARWMEEPLMAVVKSRRMTVTWLMIFLHLWLAMFREGASVFFVCDKEEKSDIMLDMAEFIYKYIPDNMMLKSRMKRSYCWMEFPGLNSYIKGVAMGADQLRLFTATAILADEFAFWERARETFMASKPTIEGGGRFTAISSPQVGFFKDVCFDLIR